MTRRVLLTGANGFVGSHILDKLLSLGHSVRAIIRSQSKAEQVLSDFPNYGSQLDFGIVSDITSPGAFDKVVQSTPPFDTVIRTASPFLYRVISDREFLDPAIKGTLEILKSTKAHSPSVKRVVITSSCAAVIDFSAPAASNLKKVYTEDDWNPMTWESALIGTQNNAYQASKKFAELSAREFVENEKPNFFLVTLNPPMVYGPIRHSVKSVKELNQSNSRIYELFINSKKDADLPPNGLDTYVDVRDFAIAHIKAATFAEALGQRFIICGGQISSQNISDLLRKNIPQLEEQTPEGTLGKNFLPENAFDCNSAKAEKLLGLTFRSKEETFVDLAKQLLEIEKSNRNFPYVKDSFQMV
ncbi:methylglyoxal reductase (NADPH-dependent) gre2 [Physocladia obscura]|uniref:Methylglyoxal reductase (NADPH-dependent) gre2 n=1 Tax=Physocladia obscura TaxID=109957 RepID=A0AAD5XBT8_9FUNG|nr:methylglyoxal reductase (NADPH-dependent) gre2 [Physocladia obscura]